MDTPFFHAFDSGMIGNIHAKLGKFYALLIGNIIMYKSDTGVCITNTDLLNPLFLKLTMTFERVLKQ